MKKKALLLSAGALLGLVSCTGIPSSSEIISCYESIESISSSSASSSSSSQSSSSSYSSASSHSSSSSREEIDYVKVFCAKSLGYDRVYAWVDTSSGVTELSGSWPGKKMTSFDNDWYTYDFEGRTSLKIIFNNGSGSQTEDMAISEPGYWYYNGSWSNTPDSSGDDYQSLDDNKLEGNIFHAFDWSLDRIKNELSSLKEAGYSAIQTSPLQKPKDYSASWTDTGNQWWKLYQPLSFSVADSSWIGNANQLKSLLTSAHSIGMKIIVDVVSNHMAGSGSGETPNPAISSYESTLYSNKSTVFRSGTKQISDYTNRMSVTHDRIGDYPDLNTSSPLVQEAVYDYLKELIDYGVDGFRFDAAKHIETPNDSSSIKSDFWEKTSLKAINYAKNNGKRLFVYGEILDQVGGTATARDYLPYMDAITDNRAGNAIRGAIANKTASSAASSAYLTGAKGEDNILWAESHDTYFDGSSNSVSQENVDKTYALVGSRKGASALYLARPGSTMNSTLNSNYKGSLVKAINKFHVSMGDAEESIYASGSLVVLERYSSNNGAVIVNLGSSSSGTLTFKSLAAGTYVDELNSKTYTVGSSGVSISFGSNGVAILKKQ